MWLVRCYSCGTFAGDSREHVEHCLVEINIALVFRQASFTAHLTQDAPTLRRQIDGVLRTLENSPSGSDQVNALIYNAIRRHFCFFGS